MPFPVSPGLKVSNKDVVSFTLDRPTYDKDKPVLIDPENPSNYISHRDATDLILKLIAGLRAVGVRPGDTVCIHSFNSLYYPIICLAVIGVGAVFVGTNPGYSSYELLHALKIAKVRFVFAEPALSINFHTILPKIRLSVEDNLFLLDGKYTLGPGDASQKSKSVANARSWQSLLEHGTAAWIRFDDEELSYNTTACYFYTSGTTGLPKCTATSHRNLVAQHQLFYEMNPRSYTFRAVLCMPFFHVGALPAVLVSQFREGREAYIMRRFDLEPFLSYHPKYNITEGFVVPPMILQIMNSGFADPNSPKFKYSLRSVKNMYSGAAPLSAELQKQFHGCLAREASMTQLWGMTETSSVATIVPNHLNYGDCPKAWEPIYGTVGVPLPGLEMKLINPEGQDVTETGLGELCVKGPTVVRGYHDNLAATKESWDEEGFFKTGDTILVDKKSGLFRVVDRSKDLIKVRGFQVAPAEIEAVILTHPLVADVGVIGQRESVEEEKPRAYVVRQPNVGPTDLTEEDVQKYVRERLARYKSLTGGVRFIDQVPRMANGKILKRVLREMAELERKHSAIKHVL
ncbi:hypothetical protein Z517_06075 [Fonsecaea pedrosoi CBS 271.37]|uniref:Unplaced genomic scaffold supercont1.4, whole genome shotgun sequence n=1 Tax=Fonsecaea pedrosoi CBS 271.37 TaxID=1442368 RepID=A0A0D2GF83_9EURO|nr:uncharacterized protein Z517_06075 [Fonsecaea pedrosoi CBS 271.37]KIW79463.1 hypothetical protein Z517_06075 [Fonsecaea pedrosoi CBS 271.37]